MMTRARTSNPLLRVLFQKLEAQGWRIEMSNNQHWRLYAPDGKGMVAVGGSISDRRAIKNISADLRRCGFKA